MACSLQGLDFAWLWALLLSAYSFAPFCSLVTISCHTTLLFLLWCYLTQACWANCLFFSQLLNMIIGLFIILLAGSCVPFIFLLGILGPFAFLGHPRPFFLTLHSHGFLLTPLGFPDPIILSFILGAHGLSISPLLSLLALLHAWCGLFSLFYITYCPWICKININIRTTSFMPSHNPK